MEGEVGVERDAEVLNEIRAIPLPGDGALDLRNAPLVMGIVNVTPDSFSDGGVHLDPAVAIESALRMAEDGADVIDVGGESTRPGSDEVGEAEELERVIPVIEGIRERSDVTISIDTRKSVVATESIAAGAGIVNDVSALRFDPAMVDVVRETGAAVILMHMRGEPKTMQDAVHYDDLIGEIADELASWRGAVIAAGVDGRKLLVDPGIGFGKTFEHNVEILARASELSSIGPLVIGASRKGFIGHLTGREAGPDRASGSLAAVAAAALAGAAMVRVHDVRETVDFLRVFQPLLRAM